MLKLRKGFAGSVMILLLSIVLSACGGSDGGGQANTAGSAANSHEEKATEQPAATTEQTTRTVTHLLGETEIPANPQRIVADQYIGHLLALGVKPVGARGDLMKSPFLKDFVSGIEDSGSPMNLERVLELKPDLIIVQSGDNYEELSKIAPTIVYEYGKLNSIEQLRLFGEILGKEKEAEEWIAGRLSGAIGECSRQG
jgi:iron complex transport system substrate-binding protein